MALPTGTSRGSGLSRSEAAILAWKKRKAGGAGGGLDPKIAARVREILASKVKGKKKKAAGGKGKAPKKVDPAKAKEKADRDKERATAKAERAKAKAERATEQASRKQEREKAKVERVAAQAKKQQAAQAKLKQAAQAHKEKAKASANAKTDKAKQQQAAAKEKAGAAQAKQSAQAQAKQEHAKQQAQAAKEKAAAPAKKLAGNRAKVANDMAQQDAGLSPGGSAALNDFADGKPLNPETAKQFEAMGLTEKGADGQHRLTAEGRQAAQAMSKGDTRAAIDAISRAGDKKKSTGDKAKAKTDAKTKHDASEARIEAARIEAARNRKALDMDEDYTLEDLLAIKAGARHSKTDMQHLQGIHDSSVACGASCGPESDDSDEEDMQDTEDAGKAIKGIMDDPGYYAAHECGDIMQAANALSTLAMLIQSELAEDDEDPAHVAMLCDASRTLVDFIGSELDELEGAAKDAAHDAGMGPMKAITEREDVNPKAGVAEYGKVDFADAKNHKYPIDTADHVRAAWNYIAKDANAAKYAADEVAQIKAKIVGAWKKLIDKAGPPSAGKALDDAWLHIDGEAIKALDNDILRGYAVRFGDAQHPDLQKDYYTKSTDFWLNHFGWPRPITYHHGMDAETRNDPVIGHWLKAGVDDVGVWMEGQMDRAHAYYKAMKELAQRGYLRLSSDSAPQWVIREKQTNGVNEIKRWPLVTSSVTVTPMEPRMLPIEIKAYLAEIGMDIDESPEAIDPDDARLDGAKASDDERARRLLLEWEHFNFEMEIG